jgi:hypothetical protein
MIDNEEFSLKLSVNTKIKAISKSEYRCRSVDRLPRVNEAKFEKEEEDNVNVHKSMGIILDGNEFNMNKKSPTTRSKTRKLSHFADMNQEAVETIMEDFESEKEEEKANSGKHKHHPLSPTFNLKVDELDVKKTSIENTE